MEAAVKPKREKGSGGWGRRALSLCVLLLKSLCCRASERELTERERLGAMSGLIVTAAVSGDRPFDVHSM